MIDLATYFESLTTDLLDERGVTDLERDEQGRLRIRLDSTMIPGVTVDTYQCFNGDSWTESELSYYGEEGVPEWMVDHPAAQRACVDFDYDDFDWEYDHRAILADLAEAAAADLIHSGGIVFDQIIDDVEVVDTHSPTFYNFATDTFTAWLTLDTKILAESLDGIDTAALTRWAEDRYASYDGFHSYIPGYFRNEPEWAIVWAAVARVLVDAEYDGLMAVAEAEHEAYSEHTTVTLNSRGVGKIWETITGEEVPEDLDLDDAESLTEALHDRLPVQDEELF